MGPDDQEAGLDTEQPFEFRQLRDRRELAVENVEVLEDRLLKACRALPRDERDSRTTEIKGALGVGIAFRRDEGAALSDARAVHRANNARGGGSCLSVA